MKSGLALIWRPGDWVPLHEAFARLKASVGSAELAARDLRNPCLQWAERCILPDGKETCRLLGPSFLRDEAKLEWWPDIIWIGFDARPERQQRAGVRVVTVDGKAREGCHYFIRRQDLEQFLGTASPASPDTVRRVKKPKIGTADWWIDEEFPNETWRGQTAKEIKVMCEEKARARNTAAATEAKQHGLKPPKPLTVPGERAFQAALRVRREAAGE
jgi:hypothetical protein